MTQDLKIFRCLPSLGIGDLFHQSGRATFRNDTSSKGAVLVYAKQRVLHRYRPINMNTPEEPPEAVGDPAPELEPEVEEGAKSTEAGLDETTASCSQLLKRRKRWVLACLFLVAVVAVFLPLSMTIWTDNKVNWSSEEFLKAYRDMLMSVNETSADDEIEQVMKRLVNHFLTSDLSPYCPGGISVAVTRNSSRIFASGGALSKGDIDGAQGLLVSKDTLFEIGSITKPFTGVVLAQEIVDGNLTLDTPINDRLPDTIPDLVKNGQLVTFKQLVTHTAGFPRMSKEVRGMFDGPQDLQGPNSLIGLTEDDMLEQISIAASELSQNNDEEEYSNFVFDVLAYLLRGLEFPALRRELTNRLGLQNTWIGLSAEELPAVAKQNLSTGHQGDDVVSHRFDGGLFIDGSGGTLSSTSDLLEFVEVLMSPKERLQDEYLIQTLQLSLQSLKETSDGEGRAFAWSYDDRKGPRVYEHSGATDGYLSYLSFQPESRTAVAAMTNCRSNNGLRSIGVTLAESLFLDSDAK